jgi:N4-(beta-N-acetylglucosaminyl)-L-asparaginase
MRTRVHRRDFIKLTSLAGLTGGAIASEALSNAAGFAVPAQRPVVISSSNGMQATARTMEIIKSGGKPIDAVIAGVNIVEDDPKDTSVGYGGLPNEDGEVELDASVMDGPTWRCGAVGGLKFIKNPTKVARLVMDRTDHIFLVGEGALNFALKMGFKKEDLLTDDSRKKWLDWKTKLSDRDNWLNEESSASAFGQFIRHYGTINCLAVDANGDMAGTTSTSGLSWKIAGRVGDSPIIGAGLYVDNDTGAAGSTGRGEANIKVCGAHTVVGLMGQGKSPEQACLETLERVVKTTKEKRLLREDGRPSFNLSFYALNKKGEYGAAALYPARFCVNAGEGSKLLDSAYLFKNPQSR